jgi:hypothetical protein
MCITPSTVSLPAKEVAKNLDVQIRCVAVDAGVTPCYTGDQGQRLGAQYVVHLLLVRDPSHTTTIDESGYWIEPTIVRVDRGDDALIGETEALKDEAIQKFYETDLRDDERLHWLFENGGADSPCRFEDRLQDKTHQGRIHHAGKIYLLETTVIIHRIIVDGRQQSEYHELVGVRANGRPVEGGELIEWIQDHLVSGGETLIGDVTDADIVREFLALPQEYFRIEMPARVSNQSSTESPQNITRVYGASRIEVRSVQIDASTTPLYLDKDGERLDPRYKLHLFAVKDAGNSDGKGPWYSVGLAKAFLGGQEVACSADGVFNEEITRAMDNEIFSSYEREKWVFEECPSSPLAPRCTRSEVGYNWAVPLETGEVPLSFSFNHHSVTIDGRTIIDYSELLDIVINDVSIKPYPVVYNPLAREIHEVFCLYYQTYKQELRERIPELVQRIDPKVYGWETTEEAQRPLRFPSRVEVKEVETAFRVTPHRLREDSKNDPEVTVYVLLLRDDRRKNGWNDEPYTLSEITTITYERQDITKLARNKACGLLDRIDSEMLMNERGKVDWLFDHGNGGKHEGLEHRVRESVWEQTLHVTGVARALRVHLNHHHLLAGEDYACAINYTEIAHVELDGVECKDWRLWDSLDDCFQSMDDNLFSIAGDVAQLAARDVLAMPATPNRTIPLTQPAQAA